MGSGVPLAKGSEALSPFVRDHMINILFTVYGVGFSLVYMVFTLFYLYANRKRHALNVNEIEVVITQGELYRNGGIALVGLISAISAWLPGANAGVPGMIYIVIGAVEGVHGSIVGKRTRLLHVASISEEPNS